MKVIKRDGDIVEYDGYKVIKAIEAAMTEVEGFVDLNCCEAIEDVVYTEINKVGELDVESIQDIVEEELMSKGYHSIAKAYILYRAKRQKERTATWEMTELQRDIYANKYRYKGEDFDEFIDRVSGGNKDVGRAIRQQDFSFGGRILAGRGLAGKIRKMTLSNCYVHPQPEDNIESIFDAAKHMARTYSYGGGIGLDLSLLRPAGNKVNNAALTTSGPVSFMDLYDTTTAVIGQKGRRGALMLSMSTNHPDINEFITSKQDTNAINHANISVRSDSEFFKQDTKSKRDTLRLIAENNHRTGEPGMLFWDRVESWHLLSEHPDYVMTSTNPCFTGDMELLTKDGYVTFKEAAGEPVDVINPEGIATMGKVWSSGIKDTVKVNLSNRESITCTPDHVFKTLDDKEVKAEDLKGLKIKPLLAEYKDYDYEFVKYGFIQGDGNLTRLESETHKGLEVNIGADDGDIWGLFEGNEYTNNGDSVMYLQDGYKDKLIELGFSSETLPTRVFPESYSKWTHLQKSSFLQGCFSANGGVIRGHRVSYKATSKAFVEQLMDTLYDDFGITAYITTNKAKVVEFSNGKYECKESYDVNISKYKDLQTFHREINFYHDYKKQWLNELLIEKTPFVTTVRKNGKEEVFDFNEPTTNWGIVNGFIAHNCGEQPLPDDSSCLLGSVNLSNFVKYPFTDRAVIDYEGLKKAVRVAVVGLNEVLHEGIPLHPLKEQREAANNFRQIGAGIMGAADMFIKLGVKYGSEESLELSHKLGQLFRDEAIKTSVELVDEYGVYPKYDYDIVSKSSFFKSLPLEIQGLIKENGMANSHVLSIAPTGSISNLYGLAGGGIEPIFANSFIRTTKSLGDMETDYKVYTKVIEDLMEAKGLSSEDELPDYCVASHDIDPIDRVRFQGVWQQYIDSAISSTVNLKEDTTVEEIENVYKAAHREGLKGVTVFRNNCFRVGILNTEDTPKETGEDEKYEDVVREEDMLECST